MFRTIVGLLTAAPFVCNMFGKLLSGYAVAHVWKHNLLSSHLGGALFGYVLIRRPWSLDFADKDAPRLDLPGAGGKDQTS